jgi:predicted acyltransferase/predicted secreted protein
MPEESKTPPPPRALALDAVRGLAILMMCLSGIVPGNLPNFMYHGYYPRFLPDADGVWTAVANPYTFRGDWASFTWVDWVFPMFLFAMGAAFPLALGRRLDQGTPMWRVVLNVLWRGVTLIGFSVYIMQVAPHFIESPATTKTWCLGLLGFVLLFPVFTRLPHTWGRATTLLIRAAGLASATALVVYLNTGDGEAFAFSHHNIIILLLAHMSIVGSLVWLASRNRLWLRLASLLVVYVAHHKAMHGGLNWLDPVVNLPGKLLDLRWANGLLPLNIPEGVLNLSALYNFTWYKFLFIVIPGTIVGDLLLRYMRDRNPDDRGNVPGTIRSWTTSRYIALGAVMAALILGVLIGLQCHGRVLLELGGLKLATPWVTWLGVVPLLLVGCALVRGADQPMQKLVRSVYLWGALWLIVGLAAEPFEGGIKKGPPSTMSYYMVSLSLSVLLLGVMTIWIDVLGMKRSASLLAMNGQNPMLAYVGIRNLLAPLVALPLLTPLVGRVAMIDTASINGWATGLLSGSPWTLLLWSLAQTVLLAAIVAAFTRFRVVWRT